MKSTTLARAAISAVVLAALLHVGARRTGPLPPLGAFLDPANGVWAVAAVAELPEHEAIAVPGLGGSVEVVFDDRGVPHIFAATSEDAARALGYVVARDRLFQMEMRWRTVAGRMSELLGDGAIGFDQRMRGLALAWSAERDFAEMDPASQVAREIAAYAGGVNAWIEGLGRRGIPLEYRLLGARPSRWEPVYSLYLLKLMGWDLTYGVQTDLRRLRLQARVGKEAALALSPLNNLIQQPIQPNGERGPRFDFAPVPPPGDPDPVAGELARDLGLALGPLADDPVPETESSYLASNNWAVSPERSAAGYALLAGDPHLELTLPSIWYEAHLVVPGVLDVYGVTIPSVPVILIGFNRDVAWSFTNTGADVIDYYEEELDVLAGEDLEQPTHYRVDGEWRPLEQRVEEYRGRGGKLLAVDTIHSTHRGPISRRGDRWLSMRWTVLERGAETDALWAAARASSVEKWLDGMEPFSAPAQNGIVADRNGTIAVRSTGRFPLHPDGSGLQVQDGRKSASDWTGYWALDRYPFSMRPRQGYLASANQQPIDPEVDDTYLGANWPTPWRAIQINALLAADSAVTPDAMRRFQTDAGNARADYFMPFFLDAESRTAEAEEIDSRAEEAARLLTEWDRRYTKDNSRAVLFELAMDELVDRTWDELNEPGDGDGRTRRVFTPASAVLAILLNDPHSVWWDDTQTVGVAEDRDDILIASLAAALERAKAQHGEPDGNGWRWDRVRNTNIYHLLGLESLSVLGLPIQGGPGSLNPSSGRGIFGASWRMVVQLGPEVEAWSIYPGGQSGNPVSSRYIDRVDRWVEGKLDPVLFPRSPSDLDAARTASILELNPER